MGGHGRALEALAEALAAVKNLPAYGFSRLANDIQTKLQRKYPFLIDDDTAKSFKPLLVAALLQTKLARSHIIPGTNGWTVDQVVSNGLFSYDEVGNFLKIPYILIWTIAGAVADPILSSLRNLQTAMRSIPDLATTRQHRRHR